VEVLTTQNHTKIKSIRELYFKQATILLENDFRRTPSDITKFFNINENNKMEVKEEIKKRASLNHSNFNNTLNQSKGVAKLKDLLGMSDEEKEVSSEESDLFGSD
jgi:hypothetical protein